MSSSTVDYSRPSRLVRKYNRTDGWLLIDVFDDFGRRRAFGSCNIYKSSPQVTFTNISLGDLYFFEHFRWLNTCQAFVRKDVAEVNRLAEDTIFHWDEIDSLDSVNNSSE